MKTIACISFACLLCMPAMAAAGSGFAFVTTVDTDFATGSSSTVDAFAPWTATPNVASIHSDAVARVFDELIYVVNRSGANNIQVIDPNDGFSTTIQFSVGMGSNPHDIMVLSPTKAYVTRYDQTDMWIVNPVTGAMTGSIDFSPWADADGSPEMDTMARVGDRVFVTVQRLDCDNFCSVIGPSYVVVVDAVADTIVDVDAVTPGTQAIQLTGSNPFSDITYPYNGLLHVSCVGLFGLLDGGAEFIDPVTLQSTGYFLTESTAGGDISDIEITAVDQGYCIISDASFNTLLLEFNPQTGTIVDTVFNPGGFVLNDIEESPTGGELFVTDRTALNPGIRIFDVATNTQLTGSPISTDLPPYDIVFVTPVLTGVGDTPVPAQERATLGRNYPNPFNPVTTIPFSLESAGHVTLSVYDSRGGFVRTLADGRRGAGPTQVTWDGRDESGAAVASGVYFVRMTTTEQVLTRKVVLLK